MNKACLLAVAVGVMMAGTSSASPVWYSYGGHQYALSEAATWSDAEAEAIGYGGHLVTINSAAENDWITAQFSSPIFIGMHQLPGSAEPGDGWVWISGEAVTYTNWHPTQPDNYQNDSIAISNWDTAALGCWGDATDVGYPEGQCRGVMEVVPEPMTLALLAFGAAVLSQRRR